MCEMVAEIPPAWLLLSETVAGEDIPVTPSEPAEGIEEDIAPSEEAGEDAAQIQSAEVIEEVERAVDKARLDNEFDNTEGKWFIAEGDFLADLNDEIDVVRRKYKVKPSEVNIPEGAIHIEN